MTDRLPSAGVLSNTKYLLPKYNIFVVFVHITIPTTKAAYLSHYYFLLSVNTDLILSGISVAAGYVTTTLNFVSRKIFFDENVFEFFENRTEANYLRKSKPNEMFHENIFSCYLLSAAVLRERYIQLDVNFPALIQ